MSDLKPCPFCGGEAQTTLRNIGDSGEDFWSVECFNTECGCDFCLYHTEAEAIEAWNTRAERTCYITPYGLPLSDCPIGKCSNCGHGADVNSKYCWQCGAKVER